MSQLQSILFIGTILLAAALVTFLMACSHKGAAKKAPSQPGPDVQVEGRFVFLRGFYSEILQNSRDIRIYLPAGYASGSASYPVLYMHDGQNLFDAATSFAGEWGMDETADRLVEEGAIVPIIMVGIDNAGGLRMKDYTPTVDSAYGGGGGDDYIRFVTQELMPYIQANYRVKTGPENTAAMGSSLGGLISCHMGLHYGHIFGMVGCVSPSLWWDKNAALKEIEAYDGPPLKARFWVDAGSAEGEDDNHNSLSYVVEQSRRYRDALLKSGSVWGEGVAYLEVKGAPHNEAAWAHRVEHPLRFFFGKDKAPEPTSLSLIMYRGVLGLNGAHFGQMGAEVRYANGLVLSPPNKDLYLTSRDEEVVLVRDDGLLEGVGVGKGTIEASYRRLHALGHVKVEGELGELVTLTLKVKVPEDTPKGERIYAVGSSQQLGAWEPGKVPMAEESPGLWTISLAYPRDAYPEYKYTRGSWKSVEKTADCEEVENRTFQISEDMTRVDTVAMWADGAGCASAK